MLKMDISITGESLVSIFWDFPPDVSLSGLADDVKRMSLGPLPEISNEGASQLSKGASSP